MALHAERARDLLDALDSLVRHRTAEPEAYRVVHAAATAAVGALHADLLDPRGGDFDAVVDEHTELARRIRAMPRPMTGQAASRSATDPLIALLGRARGTGSGIDALLGDVSSEVAPQIERAVREGLRDLFTRFGGAAGDDRLSDDPAEDPTGTEG